MKLSVSVRHHRVFPAKFLPSFPISKQFPPYYFSSISISIFAEKMSFDSSRSANSDSKSKRSLNSTSLNTSGNSNKKKKTNQKTLGMAWGSNSRSSSRSSFRSSPFSDFGRFSLFSLLDYHHDKYLISFWKIWFCSVHSRNFRSKMFYIPTYLHYTSTSKQIICSFISWILVSVWWSEFPNFDEWVAIWRWRIGSCTTSLKPKLRPLLTVVQVLRNLYFMGFLFLLMGIRYLLARFVLNCLLCYLVLLGNVNIGY